MSKFVKVFSVILLFLFSLNNSSATFFKPSLAKKIEEKTIIIEKNKLVK